MTGCSDDFDPASVNETNTYGCNSRFVSTAQLSSPYNPYDNNSSTAGYDCFEQLKTLDSVKVEDFRAAVLVCADVNPFNTGTGLTPSYDGKELITPNLPFEEMEQNGAEVAKILMWGGQ